MVLLKHVMKEKLLYKIHHLVSHPLFPLALLFTSLPPPQREYDNVPINYFDSQGAPVYAFSDPIIGHKYWDLCDCQPSGKYDYLVSYGAPPATPYPIHPTGWNDDPYLNLYYKKALKHISPSRRTTTFVAAPCAMYTSSLGPPPTTMPPSLTSPEAFPLLTPFTIDHTSHSWKIKDPITVNPDGNTKKPYPAETVLNWQSQNAVA
ncbi:hypothetical protein Patl1_13966 [Pistacia atlantica]|uniref:Uncharacterized protein n=1 Tax=Pistacia atlantica TaxID=434234 RepID=A0ACC1AUR1_9ROSI|nr:hypothetical protein Patl1_13966 [Pistacia atlantica]